MGQPCLLIIDDSPAFRDLMSHELSKRGYRTILAENGQEGLEEFLLEKPDCVLVDLSMPGMDGLTVVRKLSKQSPNTPLIIISGVGSMGDAIQAMRVGAWD